MEVPLYEVSKVVRYEYRGLRGNGNKGFTEIRPSSDGKLTLRITRSFEKIGTCTGVFQFPDNELLEQICFARALGWPPPLYYLSKAFSFVFRWPHHNSVLWPQEHYWQEVLKEIVKHAVLDTLGALSLLCRDGYFVGDIVSECSGHEADLGAVMFANNHIRRV